MKRILIVVVVLALIGVGVVAYLGVSGRAGVDQWVLRQVVTITNTYLVPEIAYDSSSYDGRGTLVMDGVTLTAPDGTEVVSAGRFLVTLAEVPRYGEPITIERIVLENASLRLIREPDGGFRGLVPFVEEGAAEQEDKPEEVRLSNVLELRSIRLENAGIEYDDASGSPLRLQNISLDLDIEPEQDEQGTTWHKLALDTGRPPVLDIDLQGRVNLDTFIAEIATLALRADIGDEEALSALPPQIQTILRERDARGELALEASGAVDARDPLASRLQGMLTLTDFNVAAGEYRLPIDAARIGFTLSEGLATADPVAVSLLGGNIFANGATARLREEGMPFEAQWQASALELKELLRTRVEGEPPTIAGKVATQGSVAGRLAELPASLDGEGTLELREARLVNIPVLTDLFDALDIIGKLRGESVFRDKVDAEFELTGTAVVLEELKIETDVVELTGDGSIAYDATLDLLMQGGVVEKVPVLGDIAGAVTGNLAKYKVTGPAGDPQIKVLPLGIGG